MCRDGGREVQEIYRHGRRFGRVCDRTEEIDRGTLEEGFPDGRALREIRQEVDNETIARLEPRQPGTGAVYEEVDMNGETEMPKVRKACHGYPHGIPEASRGTDQVPELQSYCYGVLGTKE